MGALALMLATLVPVTAADAQSGGSSSLISAPEAQLGEIQLLNMTPYTLTSVYIYGSEADEARAQNGLVDRRKGQTKTAAPNSHVRVYYIKSAGPVAWVKLGFDIKGEELYARLPDVPVKSQVTVAPTFAISINDEGGIEITQREG